MATIINTPAQADNSNGLGFLLGLLLVLAFVVLFFIYGLPYVTRSFSGLTSPQVNVPEKIDINVQNPSSK